MISPRTGLLLMVVAGCVAPGRRPESALSAGQPLPAPSVRRLTVAQYRNTLTDLLGPGLVFPMLDEEPGTGGFSTTGAAQVTTSFHGVEQYVSAAEVISRQLFGDEGRRYGVVGEAIRAIEKRVTRRGAVVCKAPAAPEELMIGPTLGVGLRAARGAGEQDHG